MIRTWSYDDEDEFEDTYGDYMEDMAVRELEKRKYTDEELISMGKKYLDLKEKYETLENDYKELQEKYKQCDTDFTPTYLRNVFSLAQTTGEKRFRDFVSGLRMAVIDGLEYIRKIESPGERISAIKKILLEKYPNSEFNSDRYNYVLRNYFSEEDLNDKWFFYDVLKPVKEYYQDLTYMILSEYLLLAYMDINGDLRNVYMTEIEDCDGWGRMAIPREDRPAKRIVYRQKCNLLRFLHSNSTFLQKK